MRSAGDIRRELLKLRDLKRIPFAQLENDARCTRHEITAALRLEATEDTLRKLDAYLDAPHLHSAETRDSQAMYEYERNSNELYRVYGAKTQHPLTFQGLSNDQKKRMLASMDYRLKCLLKEFLEATGVKVRLPDGLNYWLSKDYLRKKGVRLDLSDGNARRVLGARPVGQSRFL